MMKMRVIALGTCLFLISFLFACVREKSGELLCYYIAKPTTANDTVIKSLGDTLALHANTAQDEKCVWFPPHDWMAYNTNNYEIYRAEKKDSGIYKVVAYAGNGRCHSDTLMVYLVIR